MKRPLIAPAVLLGGLAMSAAQAQEYSYPPADLNRDGIVAPAEREAYEQGRRERLPPVSEPTPRRPAGEFTYRPADENQDGFVSQEEWDRYRERLELERRDGERR